MALTPPPLSLPSSSSSSRLSTPFTSPFLLSNPLSQLTRRSPTSVSIFRKRASRISVTACVNIEENSKEVDVKWGKVSAVLFDMDGVLCNSEEPSRLAAVDLFDEMGVKVTVEDFIPFMGTGEANFLGGVALLKGVKEFNTEQAKMRFFEIYLTKYAKPNSGIGFPGALELITQCKNSGLKVAVASSADRIKVDANLAASGLELSMFDAIVSADAFENLKPAPDIFLAASKILDVPTNECVVIEDALAGVQAANAAEMRCIAVTTTLSEDILRSADPSLIRRDIGNISLTDILSGSSYSEMKEPQSNNSSIEISQELLNEIRGTSSSQVSYSTNDVALGGLQGTRRDILRYGSLGISLTCLVFAISNWKV